MQEIEVNRGLLDELGVSSSKVVDSVEGNVPPWVWFFWICFCWSFRSGVQIQWMLHVLSFKIRNMKEKVRGRLISFVHCPNPSKEITGLTWHLKFDFFHHPFCCRVVNPGDPHIMQNIHWKMCETLSDFLWPRIPFGKKGFSRCGKKIHQILSPEWD